MESFGLIPHNQMAQSLELNSISWKDKFDWPGQLSFCGQLKKELIGTLELPLLRLLGWERFLRKKHGHLEKTVNFSNAGTEVVWIVSSTLAK